MQNSKIQSAASLTPWRPSWEFCLDAGFSLDQTAALRGCSRRTAAERLESLRDKRARLAAQEDADRAKMAQRAGRARHSQAGWPSDISELAREIARGHYDFAHGGLFPHELPVTNGQRDLLADALPPCIRNGINRDDPRYN